MNKIIESVFKYKAVNFEKLVGYGFEKEDGIFSYRTFFQNARMELTVHIDMNGQISTEVFDLDTQEPFTLFLVENAVGEFTGNIRAEYEKILTDIADKCFEKEVFKNEQTKAVIDYIRTAYGDELEFLWKKSPDNAVWRRKDSKKWYGILMTVSKRKLGTDSDEMVEIIDLRMTTENIEKTVDGRIYFKGYHMNKRHWITICLDGSAVLREIYVLIDESYRLAR